MLHHFFTKSIPKHSIEQKPEQLYDAIFSYIHSLILHCEYPGIFSIKKEELIAFCIARDMIIKKPELLSDKQRMHLRWILNSNFSIIEKLHELFEEKAGSQLMDILRKNADENVSNDVELWYLIPAKISAKSYKESGLSSQEVKTIIARQFDKLPDFLNPDESNTLVNINATDKNGFTQLSWAANSGCYELVDQYLKYGADPNMIDHYGNTALIRAIYGNYFNVVDLLIKKHADINIFVNKIDRMGDSALSIAVSEGFFDIAMLLLKHPSMDVNTVYHQEVFLNLVRDRKHHEGSLQLMDIFIKRGIDKTILGKALIKAFHREDDDMVSWLIDAGADLKLYAADDIFGLKEDKTVTILPYALAKKDLANIAKLLLAGADLPDPHKLYTFVMKLIADSNKGSIFTKPKRSLPHFQMADLYHCLSVLVKKQNESSFLTTAENKKLQIEFVKIQKLNQKTCDSVSQVVNLPDCILNMIDEYNHPHDHLKRFK